jgi:hypothetical protein
MAGTLNGSCQLALVTGTGASLAAGPDFTFFGYKSAENINLFVIDSYILIGTELADLRARNITSPARLLFIIHIHII